MAEAPKKDSFATEKGAVDVSAISLNSCPYLATLYDGVTPMAFAHSSNRCMRHQIPLKRQLQFQRAYCLSDRYTECYIFQQKKSGVAGDIDAEQQAEENRRSKYTLPVIFILVILAAFIALFVISMNIDKVTAFDLPSPIEFSDEAKSDQSEEETQPASPTNQQNNDLPPEDGLIELKNGPDGEAPSAAKSSDTENQTGDNETRDSFRAIEYPDSADDAENADLVKSAGSETDPVKEQ